LHNAAANRVREDLEDFALGFRAVELQNGQPLAWGLGKGWPACKESKPEEGSQP
jgi:hypothetical protein